MLQQQSDDDIMNVSSISQPSAMARVASSVGTQNVQSQITIAVLKQIQEQQKQMAEALLEMIADTPQLTVTDHHLDVYI